MTKQKSSPNSISESSTEKPSNPNASRLRDNQRRSRARKKEYLATLEAKYQECQRKGVEASIEIQNAARAVVRENQRLKELLRKVGVADEETERWVKEGGLDASPSDKVVSSLRARPCGEGGFAALKRSGVAARRSSTGGIHTKGGSTLTQSPPVTSSLDQCCSSGGTTSPISPKQLPMLLSQGSPPPEAPQRTQSLSSIVFKPNPSQLQTSLYTSYPTPSTTATPTSTTTSSPYNQSIPLPMPRNSVSVNFSAQQSPNTSSATSGGFVAALTATTSPILPGAVNGWNNFPIQPQLPSPALPPAVANAMYVQQQQLQQQQSHRHTPILRSSRNQHQLQQQQQMYQQPRSHPAHELERQEVGGTRTLCHVAESLISQFHPDAMSSDEIRQEICPPQGQRQSYSQPQQQLQAPQSPSEQCCGGLISCDPDDFSPGQDGDDLHMSAMDLGDTQSQRCGDLGSGGCGPGSGCRGGNAGNNTSTIGCSVDNVVLFNVLNRIA